MSIEPSRRDYSNRSFSKKEFLEVIQDIQNNSVQEVVFTKSLLPEDQIQALDVLASSKKSFKVIDSRGDRIGSLVCNWSLYYLEKKDAATFGMRKTTERAIALFLEEYKKLPNNILDFGAGTGQDAVPLLKLNCPHLVALDAEKEALTILKKHVPEHLQDRITYVSTPFMNYSPGTSFNFINSSFSWPYRPPEQFPQFWEKTVMMLAPGGYIAGHFFGPPPNPKPHMTYHSMNDIETLLEEDFDILWTLEEKTTSKIYGGDTQAWGVLYYVVARRKTDILDNFLELAEQSIASIGQFLWRKVTEDLY